MPSLPVLKPAARRLALAADELSRLLYDDLLFKVERPGQYLGNEWGAVRKDFGNAAVHLCLAFPDLYELGMSNFGQRILYQLVNNEADLLCDRTYAPASDMEQLLRQRNLALFGWESREALNKFELLGFSLAYELTYTNVLNMLELADIPLLQAERQQLFPLVFGGGPSAVNPEPMADFMDFFIIGDGEIAVVEVMKAVKRFKQENPDFDQSARAKELKTDLLVKLAKIPGVYVPSLYKQVDGSPYVVPVFDEIPARILRQVCQLNDANQPAGGLVPYLSLVHDRQVLEVRRGCDRGCRFCQPGYTFLPVRERSAEDLVRLSSESIKNTGYQEYSMLSLCVSDYTSLHESVRMLNTVHKEQRTSMSFPSQRADRMNLDIAEELKLIRKSGITLAPEAGSERLRQVINKGLRHEQIISAIEAAYKSGWSSIKLYYMIGLPTEEDADLDGIIDTLKEASELCRKIKREGDPDLFKRGVEFTCTISNFVPKPFTPFQWFGQTKPEEFARKQQYLREKLRASGLRNVTLNCTEPQISLMESVISRGSREIGRLIYNAFKAGCIFDAWDEHFKPEVWKSQASSLGISLIDESCADRQVGERQPWDVVHAGLADWWLVKEWEKAMAVKETAPCTENTCHACGVCTELDATHVLAAPKPEVMKKNPFVKELAVHVEADGDVHPSLFVPEAPAESQNNLQSLSRVRIEFSKQGELKFISHLDLQHLLIRAGRRADLPFAYSEGFNPSPKVSIALSLPIFAESEAEICEIELSQNMDAEQLKTCLNAQLPPEIQIKRARNVDKHAANINALVGRAIYKARFLKDENGITFNEINSRIKEILDQEEIITEQAVSAKAAKKSARRNKQSEDRQTEKKLKNIRPQIFSIAKADSEENTVSFCIAHGSRVHLKPGEVLKLLSKDASWQITRTALLTDNGREIFNLD